MTTPDGLDFFRVASEAGMVASIACYPNHQGALRKVAERFPEVPILCHHMSSLKVSEPSPQENLKNVLASSALPNMYLKLSGFAYLSDPDRRWEYPYHETHPIFEACYEHFGTRMTWGSDFPVVNAFMTYQQSLEAFRRHCDFVSDGDKDAILGGTLQMLLR
jgi:predicted TIM-barrel fold metal-dependent hydrolase